MGDGWGGLVVVVVVEVGGVWGFGGLGGRATSPSLWLTWPHCGQKHPRGRPPCRAAVSPRYSLRMPAAITRAAACISSHCASQLRRAAKCRGKADDGEYTHRGG